MSLPKTLTIEEIKSLSEPLLPVGLFAPLPISAADHQEMLGIYVTSGSGMDILLGIVFLDVGIVVVVVAIADLNDQDRLHEIG